MDDQKIEKTTFYKQCITSKTLFVFLLITVFAGCKTMKPISEDKTANDEDGSFSIAILPDTQYYLSGHRNGKYEMFTSQINWIKEHVSSHNIKYVTHLGDITDLGDSVMTQWEQAAKAMYSLETPIAGFPKGIPYGLAVGNHDQFAPRHVYGKPFTANTEGYNKYFGVNHFSSKSYKDDGYYGGHYGSNNDCHYDLFDVNGQGYIVIFIEYDNSAPPEDLGGSMTNWASDILSKYSDRKAIIVSHSLLQKGGPDPSYNDRFSNFSPQGKLIYDKVKTHANVFLMLCGHVMGNGGEGYREDGYNGNTIRTYLSDYQGRPINGTKKTNNGGNGLMRIMKFVPKKDYMEVKTFTPYKDPIEYEKDGDSEFTRPMLFNETRSRKLDFDQQGKTKLALFNAGSWKISGLSNVSLGQLGDIPVPADYNGNGRTEYAFWRPGTGEWVKRKEDGNYPSVIFGTSDYIPVPADYDGNGKSDIAVYNPDNGKWSVNYLLTGRFSVAEQVFGGQPGDIPIPADYDGDGKVNYAIYRPAAASCEWLLNNYTSFKFGNHGDVPVPGDYDGDGKTNAAVFRAPDTWIVATITNAATKPDGTYKKKTYKFGALGAIPAPGDYNGDGKTDIAYYLNGTLHIRGGFSISISGVTNADKLINLPYPVRKAYFL